MIHSTDEHHMFAPDDLAQHILEDHGTSPTTALRTTGETELWLARQGIESTGDRYLDKLVRWHSEAHDREESKFRFEREERDGTVHEVKFTDESDRRIASFVADFFSTFGITGVTWVDNGDEDGDESSA